MSTSEERVEVGSLADDDRTLVDTPKPPPGGVDGPTALTVPRLGGPTDGDSALVLPGWAELRATPFFSQLPDEVLTPAFLAQLVRARTLGRDELVPLDGSLILVRRGQVVLGRFAPDELHEEWAALRRLVESVDPLTSQKAERVRRDKVGPLAERAERNLAVFEEGELIEAARHDRPTLGCYALTPAEVVLIDPSLVSEWSLAHPAMADRFRRGVTAVRTRLAATDGAQAAVADFFVRHGLSVSRTLRVRKLAACIECRACEQACVDRYGVKRLSLNGRILGGLDFVDACHSCTDARCIDACDFDAISFDPAKHEILIKEDACTGCTLCASACPYDAIEIHELEQQPLLQIRLTKQNALAFGEGTPRVARTRRIASKCDHCASYEDQACISACPTGALLELAPADVVPKLPSAFRESALAGFDRTSGVAIATLNNPEAFQNAARMVGRRRTPVGSSASLPLRLLWTVGLAALMLTGVEVALRVWWPLRSLQFFMTTRVDGVDPELALLHVDYHAGGALAVQLGWVGTALLLASMIYVPRKRLRWLRNLGALQPWFDWHVWSSSIGAGLIAVHTAARLDNWVSIPFWSMVLTVASGIAGRLMALRLEGDATLSTLELERRMAQIRGTEAGVRPAAHWLDRYQERVKGGMSGKGPLGALAALWRFALDVVLHPARLWGLRRALRRSLTGGNRRALRQEVAQVVDALALAERRRVLNGRLLPLFRSWKAVHVPLAILLTALGALHVWLELTRR